MKLYKHNGKWYLTFNRYRNRAVAPTLIGVIEIYVRFKLGFIKLP